MKYDIEVVKNEILTAEPNTKFYIGCDSRKGKTWASYATVFIVHIGGNRGCRVYGRVERERDFGNLRMRLLNEAYKATGMVMELQEYLVDKDFSVHLDINSNPNEKSHIAMKEAAGYVLGMTGIKPIFKPEAMAASCCADLFEAKSLGVNKTKLARLDRIGKIEP